MPSGTFTLIASPLGDMAPGRPIDVDRLPPDARAWAERQAGDDNEMLTALDGDHSADLADEYAVYVVQG